MKKIIAILLMVSMIFTLAACGQDAVVNQDNDQEVEKTETNIEGELTKLDKIKQSGKLVIGTSAAYPPYEFHKEVDGKDAIVGFDIDIAKEIAKDLGVELEIKDLKFDGLLAALNAGTIDIVIAGMTPTDERKEKVDFSKVYYVATQSVLVNEEKIDSIKTVVDLKDKKLGVQKGTIQEQIANELVAESQIKSLGKVSDVMLEIINNKIDAVIVESPVAKAYAQKNEKLAVSTVQLDTGDSGSAIAIKKGNEALVEAVNSTLDKLMENGLIDKFIMNATEMVEN